MLTEIAWIVIAVYITIIVATGMYSSWEYAAILCMISSIAPLIVVPNLYLDFLKITLIKFGDFSCINVFTVLLFFDSIIIAYAFNAWVKTFFIALFILLIAYYSGFLSPTAIANALGGG